MNEIQVKSQLAAYYELEAVRYSKGGIELSRRKFAPFHNLVTDTGVESLAVDSNFYGYCKVGTGTTPPAFTDTGLVSPLAASAGIGVNATFSPITTNLPNLYAENTIRYDFAVGAAAGNLTEIGIFNQGATRMFSRALILDGNGQPTTITILPDEQLLVTYSLRMYSTDQDVTGVINISGTDYGYTLRPASWNLGPSQYGAGWGLLYSQYGSTWFGGIGGNSYATYAYSGAMGAVGGAPAGTSSQCTGMVNAAYVPGSHEMQATASWQTSSANFAGGVNSFTLAFGICVYQMGLSAPIMKDSTKIMSLTFKHSWARKII